MRRLVVALGLTALTALPARAQEPDLVPRLLTELNNMIGRIEEQRTTIDSLRALPADSGLVARVDSLRSVLTAERAQHDLLVDSLEVVIADLRDEPPDTTTDPPQPTTVALTALPDTMAVGDTAAVTGALLDELGAAITTPAAEWNVQITGSLRFAGYSGLTNFVRAAVPGAGAVRYTHLPSGLEAESTTQVRAPPDTTAEAVAATVPSVQHVLLVGDAVTVRPNLIDAVGGVVPSTPSEWDVDFDPAYLTVSGAFLVTAIAPTPGGSETAVTYRHIDTQLEAEVDVVVLPDEDPNPPGPVERPAPVAGWPLNEPPGMTPIAFADGSSLVWPGFLQNSPAAQNWATSDRISIVDDANAKYGKAIQKDFRVGDVSGWSSGPGGPFGAGPQITGDRHWKSVYVRVVMMESNPFDHHQGGDKWWVGSGDDERSAHIHFYDRQGTFYAGGHIVGPPITARQFRPIIPGSPRFSGASPFGNGPFARAKPGQYHTIEIVKTAQDPGQANGSMRLWIDGVEYKRFSLWGGGEAYLDFTVDAVRWTTVRDGEATSISSNLECCLFWGGQNDVKALSDYIRISEVYVSAR